jgi:hypothetical protein
VKAIARNRASDAKLLYVFAIESDSLGDTTFNGKFELVQYDFYSPSQKLSVIVIATPLGFSEFSRQDTLSYFVEVPANFIDTDSIFAICEANGGASFRSRIPNTNVFYQLGRVFGAPIAIDTTKAY